MRIYLVQNTLSGRFGNPTAFATDAEAVYNLPRFLSRGLPLERQRLWFVGEYDESSGQVTSVPPVVVEWNQDFIKETLGEPLGKNLSEAQQRFDRDTADIHAGR